MKKFKNGVPVLSESAMASIKKMVTQGYYFNTGNVAISLNPKYKRRGKNIKIVEVYTNRDSSKLFVWYKGYHYRITSSLDVVPLSLRKKRIIRFYKNLNILKKKGSKHIPLDKVI